MAEKTEVSINFSPEAWEELEKLKKELRVASAEDVIRNALAFLRWSRDKVKGGKPLVLLTQVDPLKIRPVRLSFLD